MTQSGVFALGLMSDDSSGRSGLFTQNEIAAAGLLSINSTAGEHGSPVAFGSDALHTPIILWLFPFTMTLLIALPTLVSYLSWKRRTLGYFGWIGTESEQDGYIGISDQEEALDSAAEEESILSGSNALGIPWCKWGRDPKDANTLSSISQLSRWCWLLSLIQILANLASIFLIPGFISGNTLYTSQFHLNFSAIDAYDCSQLIASTLCWTVSVFAYLVIGSSRCTLGISQLATRLEDSRRRRAVVVDLNISLFTFGSVPALIMFGQSIEQHIASWSTSSSQERMFQILRLILTGYQLLAVIILALLSWRLTELLNVNLAPSKSKRLPSPEATCSIWEFMTISWFTPVMLEGYRRTLLATDFWDVLYDEQVLPSVASFAPVENYNIHLLFKLIWVNGRTIAFQQFLVVITSTLYFTGPFFLNRILSVLEHKQPMYYAYIFAVGMFCASLVRLMAGGLLNQTGRKLSMRMRNVLVGIVYRKALRRAPVLSDSNDSKDAPKAKNPSTNSNTPANSTKRVPVKGKGKSKEKGKKNDSAESSAKIGKIVNMMSVDATKVGENGPYLHLSFVNIYQIIVAVLSLVYVMGWSALAGVLIMIVMTVCGVPVSRAMKTSYRAVSKKRDERTDGFAEMLHCIRIMKFLAWESLFGNKVRELRNVELEALRKYLNVIVFNRVYWYTTPVAVSFATFYCYTKIMGMPLTAAAAFTALALFEALRWPLEDLPDNINSLLDTLVAVERINSFLDEDDLPALEFGENSGAGFHAASFTWDWGSGKVAKKSSVPSVPESELPETGSKDYFQLQGLDIKFPVGKLTCICGATGSGKTSLISALLGEMRLVNGKTISPNRVAFVAQQAFILNASIRDNILFGSPFDPERYRQVIAAAALLRDLEVFEDGDLTEVGEKGITLSGGQKQRISLARAAYSNAEFCVLDDPLSAVDAPTGKWLLENLILGPLLKGRTTLLVTNATSLCLPRADHLVLLSSGAVIGDGPVDTVLAMTDRLSTSGPFAESLLAVRSTLSVERRRREETTNNSDILLNIPKFEDGQYDKAIGGSGQISKSPSQNGDLAYVGKLTGVEKVEEGYVKWNVVSLYYKAFGGPFYVGLYLVWAILSNIITVGRDYWVKIWASSSDPEFQPYILESIGRPLPWVSGEDSPPFIQVYDAKFPSAFNGTNAQYSDLHINSPPFGLSELDWFLVVYFALGIANILSVFGHLILMTSGFLRAGRSLHEQMLVRLLKAPIRFFETTPTGRILNRFTKDVQSADSSVGSSGAGLLRTVVFAVTALSTVAFIIPVFPFLIVPLVYVYYRVALFYVPTARSVKRVSSVARSPIYGHFSETLAGLSTIRAYKDQERFTQISSEKLEYFCRSQYSFNNTRLWLNMRLQLISAMIAFVATMVAMYSSSDAGLVGWIISITLAITSRLQGIVNSYTRFETDLNAIERIKDYLELPIEAPSVIDDCRPPENWPTRGEITVENLEARYSPDLPAVLHGLSFTVNAQEKVGIVGRTGAGKSSLSLCFFRFMEPSNGTIIIDGVDICKIGLADLRGHLTIIPQDPVLFEGTVRSNLDPFGQHSDERLIAALRRAHLVDSDELSSSGSSSSSGTPRADNNQPTFHLGMKVAENGKNLSTGQAQLLCLARALVCPSKVVLLDEATASVDNETDGRVQQTIRSELKDSTILCIAHRLKTVIDYDKILVLDAGKIAQFGTPLELIRQTGGIFRRMCEESGEFDVLLDIAQQAAHPSR